jgi:aminoglycoside phosphotransferase
MDGPLTELLNRLAARQHDAVTLGHSGATVMRLQDASGQPIGYLKTAPSHIQHQADLIDAERTRLDWLRAQDVPVPKILDAAHEPDLTWMLTAPVPSVPASDPWPTAERNRVAAVFGETLRKLHQLDPTDCPFDFSPQTRPKAARQQTAMPNGTPVIGHGDYCLPNVLLAPDGAVHLVDVGRAGLADRHSDLADALRSIRGPLNPQFDESHAQRFLDAYGRADIVDDRLRWFDDLDRWH